MRQGDLQGLARQGGATASCTLDDQICPEITQGKISVQVLACEDWSNSLASRSRTKYCTPTCTECSRGQRNPPPTHTHLGVVSMFLSPSLPGGVSVTPPPPTHTHLGVVSMFSSPSLPGMISHADGGARRACGGRGARANGGDDGVTSQRSRQAGH